MQISVLFATFRINMYIYNETITGLSKSKSSSSSYNADRTNLIMFIIAE